MSLVERAGLWTEDRKVATREAERRIKAAELSVVRLAFADQHGVLRGKTLVVGEVDAALKNGLGFTTTMLLPSGNSDYATIATIVQAELKPLGINVQIQQLDPNTANENFQSGKYDMSFSLWTMDIPDPDELATFALDPTAGSKSFFTFYDNPTVVNAVHAAEVTTDTASRQADYNTAQTLAAQDAFMAFLYYSPYPYVESSNVHGFLVTPLGNYHMEDVWLSPGS